MPKHPSSTLLFQDSLAGGRAGKIPASPQHLQPGTGGALGSETCSSALLPPQDSPELPLTDAGCSGPAVAAGAAWWASSSPLASSSGRHAATGGSKVGFGLCRQTAAGGTPSLLDIQL